jgi:hypothetical protein
MRSLKLLGRHSFRRREARREDAGEGFCRNVTVTVANWRFAPITV